MTQLPADPVTFLFTDIEGSTQLWEEHPESMQSALLPEIDVNAHWAVGSSMTMEQAIQWALD